MEKFCYSIKRKYRERLINRQEQWPPCRGEKLIHLELVKRKRGEGYVDEREKHHSTSRELAKWKNPRRDQSKEDVERVPIAYSDLFKSEIGGKRRIRRVLVEGDAGIGKTTLCTSISEDWANEKLFQGFDLLLLLPLREKEVASAGSLPELLALLHSSTSLQASVTHYIEEEEGEKILIVADGWDELNETERHDQSFLYKLLFGKLFPFVSVLLTSRPSASAPLHKSSSIDRLVAICGFNKDNIKEYIQLEFAGDKAKSDSLLDQLESNPLIESTCSIPLNCAIICHLWRTLEEALPATMTELYTKIILNILLRNIRKSYPSLEVEGITSFDTLPGDLSESWWLLCEFAFLALTKDHIVFSQKELVEYFPQGLNLGKKVLCFGLLQYTTPILDTGYGMSFHFLHLTFQEYLAAIHFVKQPLESVYRFESSLAFAMKSHFSMIWRFSSGIIFKNLFAAYNFETEIFIDILIRNHINGENYLELCHCAFEADYKPMTEKVIECMDRDIPIPLNAHDCAAVLYLLENYNSHNLGIQFDGCASSKLIIKLADILANKHGSVQITELYLNGGHLTDNDICHLFNRAASAFQSIQCLEVNNNEINTPTFMITSPLVMKEPFCNLYSLNISYNPLRVSGIQYLENAIIAGSLVCLSRLIIQQTLTSDQDINGALLNTLCSALSTHCPHLRCFDASHNNLGTPGAQAIGSALHQINKQEKGFALVLSNAELHDESVGAFVSHLNRPCYLRYLILSSNSIGDDGASCLFQTIITSNSVLWTHTLNLSGNPIGFEQILSLITASNCSLWTLSLCKCWLTEYPMRNQPVTQQMNTIKCLHLDENNFDEKNILILVHLMNSCPNLEVLSCCQCGITSEDLRCLLSQLSFSCIGQLQTWCLNDNGIDDSGISALIECIPLFSPSCLFRIDGNPVSSEMQRKLCTAVTPQNLCNSSFDILQIEGHGVVSPMTLEEFQTQWEVIVSYLYQLSLQQSGSTLAIEPESEITLRIAEIDNEESYEAASEGEEVDAQCMFPPSMLSLQMTNCATKKKGSVESYDEGLEVLTIRDLAKVQSEIWEARTKWYNLGLQLGVTVDNLDAIQYNHPTNCDKCFIEMIKGWLRASGLQQTWEALAKALESPQVGQGNLAKQIRSIK